MHYAVEGIMNSTGAGSIGAIVEICAMFLLMNALCRVVVIGCTISEIRADCLYLAGRSCSNALPPSDQGRAQ